MSTSLLYHAFGIRGYDYQRTSYEEGTVVFTIRQKRSELRCSECGTREVQRRGHVTRELQHVPIGGKPVFVELDVARVHCPKCDHIRQVQVPLADSQRSYTRAFARYVLELRQSMTLTDVAHHLGVSDWMVRDIEKRMLQRKFSRPKLRHLKQIAIDEISIGKGHRYVTVVLDLDSGAIVHVGDGKGGDALKPFWRRLKASRARIEAVATDMSPAYIQAVIENLSNAALVFDRFHVVKLFNDRLSDFRRQLYREAADGLAKDVLKGTRWLLLMNPENLNEERNEKKRLELALSLNQPLATAYYLKEDLRQFWQQPSRTAALQFLKDWCSRARASGIRFLQKFANTLEGHRSGLLAWYAYPISTGPLEGVNNKIKTLKRQAYGFRDQDYFRLKLYALHKTKHALVG
jgi:transposase